MTLVPLIDFSIQELSAEIKNGNFSAVEVAQSSIEVIKSVNPHINALVEDRFTQALEDAALLDKQLKDLSKAAISELSPFWGVPCSIKEMISVKGMKSTLGSIHRQNHTMDRDASVVTKLKENKSILMGTTNVPEVGFWFECDNVVYGKTNNPYTRQRTSGGSSGGEGALIATGGTLFGLGSDIGGSIRMPAAFCGVFGHKPSDRLIPFTGHVPIYHHNAHEIKGAFYPFTVLGPLTRKACDLHLVLKALIGPDGFDQETKKDFALKPLLKSPSEIKVYYLPFPRIHGTTETETDLSQSVIHSARYLRELGAFAQELPEKIFIHAFDFWTGRAWSIEGKDFPGYLSDGKGLDFKKEFFQLLTGRRKHTLPALLTAFVETYAGDRSKKEEFLLGLQRLKSDLTEMLKNNGVILMPVHPRKAPFHHSTYARPFDFAYTGIFNALGFPATSVPLGLSENGLPLSVQVIAAEDHDHLCLSVAQWLEQGFGGSLTPPLSPFTKPPC